MYNERNNKKRKVNKIKRRKKKERKKSDFKRNRFLFSNIICHWYKTRKSFWTSLHTSPELWMYHLSLCCLVLAVYHEKMSYWTKCLMCLVSMVTYQILNMLNWYLIWIPQVADVNTSKGTITMLEEIIWTIHLEIVWLQGSKIIHMVCLPLNRGSRRRGYSTTTFVEIVRYTEPKKRLIKKV